MCGPHLECDTSKSQQPQLFCAGCPGASPAITASYRGSQLFLYHANAVKDFRSEVLAPWFVRYASTKGHALDEVSREVHLGPSGRFWSGWSKHNLTRHLPSPQDRFVMDLKSLQAKHLAATLTHLAPANALPMWAAKVQV